jgi:AcrR family transcriptional regulator
MADRQNRRELLIETAARLFQEYGYNATSVRQIADAVGVTESALYYHFKEGKRGLFQAVLEHYTPNILIVEDNYTELPTFGEFVRKFIQDQDNEYNHENIQRLRWILLEYPTLNPEEQAFFHHKAQAAHQSLTHMIHHYIEDDLKARRLAWLLLMLLFGYGQMFINLGIGEIAPEFMGEDVIDLIAEMFGTQAH